MLLGEQVVFLYNCCFICCFLKCCFWKCSFFEEVLWKWIWLVMVEFGIIHEELRIAVVLVLLSFISVSLDFLWNILDVSSAIFPLFCRSIQPHGIPCDAWSMLKGFFADSKSDIRIGHVYLTMSSNGQEWRLIPKFHFAIIGYSSNWSLSPAAQCRKPNIANSNIWVNISKKRLT